MKVNRYYFIYLVLTLLYISSCGKKIVPALVDIKEGNDYDVSAFNYVYIDAIKQKLMGNEGNAMNSFKKCIEMNPESGASYYQMGQIVIANRDLDNGKYYAKKALSIEPENIWYLMMLAGIYYQDDNLDSAIIYYEKAVEYFPDRENLQLTLGNLYSENRNYEKANTIFNSLDEKYGINETSTLSSIQNLMSAKRYDEALLKTQLLIQEYPDEILYNGLLAEIYSGKGENDRALEVYKRLIEKNPDDPQIQLALSNFLLSERSYDELFKLLNTIILNNKVTREDKISLLAQLMELPEVINEQGDKVMITFMVLEAYYKEDDVVPLLRPDLLVKQGKLIEASNRLEEIIAGNKNNYYAWEKLLLVYLELGDYDKLMNKGKECATRFNRSFPAKVLYANGAIENNEFSIALEELRKAKILAGNNKELNTQVLTMKADVYYRMKDYTKAFEIFDEAIKYNEEDLTIINNYAYYLAEQNMKLKEAEKMARKVIKKEKDNSTYLDTYAWVLYKRGKINEAGKIMERIIKSEEKTDAEYYEHYGFILKKQKKCKEAIENWNIALKIDSTKTNLTEEIRNCKR